MKAAVLLQGDPRFCSEFDLFLENLKEFDQVDYFMYMWEDNYPTADLLGNTGHQVVAPVWQHINRDWALNKFKEFLPEGHRVVSLELANQHNVTTYPINENFAQETRKDNVWKMWYSLYMANQACVKHQIETNLTYDVVIRTRPDVALMHPVHASSLKAMLDNDPNTIIMPRNKRCGYNGVWVCDLFGIGKPDAMTKYCDLYNQALEHHASGVLFHPETMLGKHLKKNGCNISTTGFEIEFRHQGIWRDISTGEEWLSTNVPGWHNKIYISKFGRWGS